MDTAESSVDEGRAESDGGTTRRFMLLLFLLVVLLETLYHAIDPTGAFDGLRSALAWLAASALGLFEPEAFSSGSAVRLPGYSVGVDGTCDGLQLCALWLAAVVAFPVGGRAKLAGLVFGLVWLEAWNVMRIASLVVIGDRFGGEAFRTAHLQVWPVVLLAITIVSWLVWARVSTWETPTD